MTNIYVDANALIFLTRAGTNSNTGNIHLNNLIQPNADLIITTTVVGEVRDNLSFAEEQIFNAWYNQNLSAGEGGIQEVRTFREGSSKGELSIVDAFGMLGDASGDNLIIASDINRFDWAIQIPGIDQIGVNPDAPQLRDTVKSLDAMLFNGIITPKQYLDTIEGLMSIPEDDFSGELYDSNGNPRFIELRQPYIGPDGSTFTLVGGVGWIQITRPDGEVIWVAPDQKFIMNGRDFQVFGENELCFAAGTPVQMWPLGQPLHPGPDGVYDQSAVLKHIWQKPIEEIKADDLVVSFDKAGNLVPGTVARTMVNDVKIILNFHGTLVTPGHVYYRPDSARPHKFETLIDILRDDGVIELTDGTQVRAATQVPVDDPDDGFVWAVAGTRFSDGTFNETERKRIRLGTRFVVEGNRSFSVAELIAANGGVVGEDEMIRVDDGAPMPFHWDLGDRLPKPEDYVLQCSGTTLEDIYKVGEWEDQRPAMPTPMVLDSGPVQPMSQTQVSRFERNEPLRVRKGNVRRDEQMP